MASKLTREFLQEKSISVRTWTCLYDRHGGECQITDYVTAVQAYGSEVAHRMTFVVHSADEAICGSARPACGSRRTLGQHSGAFRPAVTCKRC